MVGHKERLNLIVIISLIIIDLLLLKQYNQQTNILLSFLKHLCERMLLKECMLFRVWLCCSGFNLKGIILS
ncbi:hypothetical protein [Helicobacter pylori]|uniref:hypothetical protein n=1 Tax=Helicobacter pylori TaxID=210 RepID=UPI001F52C17A|nr:hypothetical protein [Helicobacter pylori]